MYSVKSFDNLYVMIDWDDTMSLNPEMFKLMIGLMEQNGFICKICTARSSFYDNSDIESYMPKKDIIYCDGFQKRDVVEKLGMKVAFWIDDYPEAIVNQKVV